MKKLFKLFKLLNYYSINGLLEFIKAFLNFRYIFLKQRFLGQYTLRNKKNIYIGKKFKAYNNFFAEAHNEGKIYIGDECVFNRNAYLTAFEEIRIGDNVLFGPNVFIGDHDHGIYEGENHSFPDEPPVERLIRPKKIKIGDNVWIGNNVTITKGSVIGKGTVIGANSVVVGSIQPFSIAAGIPAQIKKKFKKKSRTWEKEK